MSEDKSRRRFLRDGLMFGAGLATAGTGVLGLGIYQEYEYGAQRQAEDAKDYKDNIIGQIENGLKMIDLLDYEYPNDHRLNYQRAKYIAVQKKYEQFLENEQDVEMKGIKLAEHVSKLAEFNHEVLNLQINTIRLREILQEEKGRESLKERL